MRKLLTALATTSMLMASNATIWKAEAAMVTGVGNRLWRIAIRPSKRFAVSAAVWMRLRPPPLATLW